MIDAGRDSSTEQCPSRADNLESVPMDSGHCEAYAYILLIGSLTQKRAFDEREP